MQAFNVKPADIQYVVGPSNRPLPSLYWMTANHPNSTRNPTGLAMQEGRLLHAGSSPCTLVLTNNDKAIILDGTSLSSLPVARFAVGGTRRLLRNGSLDPDLSPDKVTRRSAVGIQPGGNLIHMMSEQATERGLALVLQTMGCYDALQLAYGPNSTLSHDGQLLAGEYPVTSLIGADRAVVMTHPVIVVDPGHGGKEPGAGSTMLPHVESHYNLLYAGALKNHLQELYPCTVFMTRQEDVDVSLSDRALLANAAQAGLFISCHCNAAGGRGFESFISKLKNRDREGKDLTPEEQAQHVIHGEIRDKVLGRFEQKDRGQKREDFYVLRKTDMPAVLLESAFMDHPEDARLLADITYLKAMGMAAGAGAAKFLGLSRRPEPPPPVGTKYVVEIEASSLAGAQVILQDLTLKGYTAKLVEKKA